MCDVCGVVCVCVMCVWCGVCLCVVCVCVWCVSLTVISCNKTLYSYSEYVEDVRLKMKDVPKDITMTDNFHVFVRCLFADSRVAVLAVIKPNPLPCSPFQTITFCHPNILC